MKKPNKGKRTRTAAVAGRGGTRLNQLAAADQPTTELLAILAAILARSTSVIPDAATYGAMEMWKSAQERKHTAKNYYNSHGSGVPYPTTEQLATLAVNLAKNVNDDPKALAEAALRIWFGAGFTLEGHRDESESQLVNPPIFTGADEDKEGNILRDSFFRKALPPSKKYRTYDLGRIGKAFIRHLFQQEFKREPTAKEFEKFYGNWNAGKNEKASLLARVGFGFWYSDYVSAARRAAGKQSAAKKKLKKKL